MTNVVASKLQFHVQSADEYPSSDGKPRAETEVHILALLHLLSTLRFFFASRKMFLLSATCFSIIARVTSAPTKPQILW